MSCKKRENYGVTSIKVLNRLRRIAGGPKGPISSRFGSHRGPGVSSDSPPPETCKIIHPYKLGKVQITFEIKGV